MGIFVGGMTGSLLFPLLGLGLMPAFFLLTLGLYFKIRSRTMADTGVLLLVPFIMLTVYSVQRLWICEPLAWRTAALSELNSMIELRLAVSILLLLTLPLAQAETLTGRVVRVTDGDTIVVLDTNKVQHKIRLTGIDAPERGQALGTKSKEHLSDLVAGKTVEVDYSKYDRYQRIFGKILLNGEDVNLEQVEAGMAWHYKKYQREQTPTPPARMFDTAGPTR